MEEVPSDPGLIASSDIDPSKIQIIETKAIPKAGAQLPPTTEGTLDPDPARGQAQPDMSPPASDPVEPQKSETPPVAVSMPTPEPVVHAQTPPSAPQNLRAPSDGRVGVIIPDSLRNSPSPAPASSLEPFAVPEQTALSLLVHRVDPDYPAQALQQRLEGPVVLQVGIAKDGSVRDLKLVKGYFLLGRAAFDAVRQWRFKAYSQNGKAIDFQTLITLNFKYPGQPAGQ
jgi:protein TonB